MNKKSGITKRVIKSVFEYNKLSMPIVIFCILFTAVASSSQSIFMQKIIAVIENNWKIGDWSNISRELFTIIGILVVLYVLSLVSAFVYNRMMATITQRTLKELRQQMFNRMESLPISFFDTNNHGDIMSHYTNDIDTLRQLVSQSFPQLLISSVTVITILGIMLYYCVWLAIVVLLGITIMIVITGKVGGNSSKHFTGQQISLGKTEGFIEEMIKGQRVIKIFNHEEESKADFDKLNDELFDEARKANTFANMLGPILNNIGNLLYVVVAVVGGLLLIFNVNNISISGMAISISVVVPFLNMTKMFAGNVNQVSQQVNVVVQGLAGARRVFKLIDEEPEVDKGYVTLVNAIESDGELKETEERTGIWAWKHPHTLDETVTYTKVRGEVTLNDVDFSYVEDKQVLNGISVYAEPGEKVAFVGATGAGKTTITNLINRFYDIADGKIRYDGININKIKKDDLRRSLGIVLQDTNLFTGTVMNNIRYGNLTASDNECVEAAKLAGADDFITRLPEGYETQITGNGSNLSQGQRQLLAIARAAVNDPPVMILDEATSSIDTRTESIVQKGMDALMKGRTVFVIAHRLSTVKNSDVIMVMKHGRIIERGSHENLIEKRGEYYQLYTGAFELE
ncbi:MAG: ABC transporter ATP-binding protein [Suipraeoptans sp.]